MQMVFRYFVCLTVVGSMYGFGCLLDHTDEKDEKRFQKMLNLTKE